MHTVQTSTYNRRSVHPVANSSDNPSNDHLRDTIRRRLQHRSDRQDETSQPDAILSTESFASEQAEQRSCEATNLIDGDYKTLK